MGASAAPLAIIQPTFGTSPQEQQSRMNLQQMAGQKQIQQQTIAENDLKIQAARQQHLDQEAAQRAFVDANGDIDQMPLLAAKYGASVGSVQQLKDVGDQAKLRIAQTADADLGAQQKKAQSIGSTAQALLNLPEDQMMAELPKEIEKAKLQKLIPDTDIPSFTDPKAAKTWLSLHSAHAMTVEQMAAKEINDRKAKQDALKSDEELSEKYRTNDATLLASAARQGPAALQKAIGELPYARAKVFEGLTDPSEILKLGVSPTEALKTPTAGTPDQWKSQIDSVVDPKKYPEINARAQQEVQFALQRNDTAEAQKAKDKALATVTEIEKETNPEIKKAKLDAAIAQAKAMAPIIINRTVATEQAKANANLTDDDYKRAGEEYALTGVMPSLGRTSAERDKIAHWRQEYARDNSLGPRDLVVLQAAYKGDADSLKKFQAQRDQIVSFENTAQKNLDLFLDAASKIPDTGVPWINKPIRDLDANIVGSANMAAVNAARQVANNEIAKVTSGGGLSGVLSDSARKEVGDYNPKDATFAQTKAVAAILKKDMANRHGSMDSLIGQIKERMGTTGGTPSGAAPGGGSNPQASAKPLPSTLSSTDVGKVFLNRDGKLIKITTINPDNPKQFKYDEVQ